MKVQHEVREAGGLSLGGRGRSLRCGRGGDRWIL